MQNNQESRQQNIIADIVEAISENFLFKESGKIIALGTFIFAVVTFFMRSLWYFYQWGKFDALNVSTAYIAMDNQNQPFYEALAFCAFAFAYVLSNAITYKAVQKKKYNIIGIVIFIEYLVLTLMVMIEGRVKFKELFHEITQQNGLIQFLKISFGILVIVLIFNLLGIARLIPINRQNNFSVGQTRASLFKTIKAILLEVSVIICIQFLAFYIIGYYDGANQEGLKLIQSGEAESDLIGMDEKYIFSGDTPNSAIVLRAVLVETQNEYITCYCYREGKKLYANINLQCVIPKENIVTMDGYTVEKVLQ